MKEIKLEDVFNEEKSKYVADFITFIESLKGMDLNSAKEKLKDKEYRIVRIDGVGMMVTCDYRTERLNLEVENNLITNVYGG
ncbi:MAG TPA: hypothetical protein VLA48_02975 [Nitrososphaeraceae archaeon]|nr:hypothetical protein [Nitrososphaeraceae archaeon]